MQSQIKQTLHSKEEIEIVAKALRKDVRWQAELPMNWRQASENMKAFYRDRALLILNATYMEG